MGEDLSAQIAKKEAELAPLRERMEQFKIEFIKETIVFAVEWYRKTVKEYVAKYPEVTLNMSEEKISKMKAKLQALTVNNDKTVDELNNPSLWWHQKPNLHDSIDQYTQISDKYPEKLDRAVRQALGRLGIILEEFRYHVNVSGNAGSFQEFWFEHTEGTISTTVPYYPHLLKWSDEMQETIRKYNIQYLQATKIFKEIQKLVDEKKRQQAMSRWDSI
jgi:hypothetical protein